MKRRIRAWSPGKGFELLGGHRSRQLTGWVRYGNTTSRFVIVTWAMTDMLTWDGKPWTDYDALELWTVDVPTHGERGFFWTLKDKRQRVTWLDTYPDDDQLGVIVKREPLPADLVRQRARAEAWHKQRDKHR